MLLFARHVQYFVTQLVTYIFLFIKITQTPATFS